DRAGVLRTRVDARQSYDHRRRLGERLDEVDVDDAVARAASGPHVTAAAIVKPGLAGLEGRRGRRRGNGPDGVAARLVQGEPHAPAMSSSTTAPIRIWGRLGRGRRP